MRVKKTASSTIGSRLREVRIEKRLTQKEMGVVIGLTPGSVGAMENDAYTPNYDVLRILKKRLNVPYEYIIDGDANTSTADELKKENMKLKQELERHKKIIDKLIK